MHLDLVSQPHDKKAHMGNNSLPPELVEPFINYVGTKGGVALVQTGATRDRGTCKGDL